MAADLHDFRGKHTTEIKVALEAEARLTGKDKAEIEREVMQAWAVKKIHGARLLAALAAAEGVLGESQGIAGNSGESKGGKR